MEPLALALDARGPVYRQLYRALRDAMLDGRLATGDRLPSTRALARQYGCSRNVVLLAYDLLLSEGYTEGRPGSGTYVSVPDVAIAAERPQGRRRAAAGPPPKLSAFARRLADAGLPAAARVEPDGPPPFDFRYGVAGADEITRRTWRRLLQAASRQPQEDYLSAAGHPELRHALAGYLRRARGLHVDARQMLIVNGSQQALDLIARVFVDEGDAVVIEDPCYRGARAAFAAAGARLVPLRIRPGRPDRLRLPAAGRPDVKLAYVTPSHQFPLGHVMPVGARLALLAWARARGVYVVEDDYDSEYRYDGPPLQAVHALDTGDRTIYVGTLSKVLFPALRLGYVVVPESLADVFARARFVADRHTPTVLQAALAAFVADGHFERHLRRSRARNAERRAVLLAALERHLGRHIEVEGENAGVHVVVWFDGFDADAFGRLIQAARGAGVGLYPVSPCFHRPPVRQGAILGFSALEPAAIEEGVRRLASAHAAVRQRRRPMPA